MIHGTPIDRRQGVAPQMDAIVQTLPVVPERGRLLTTAEANAFLKRAPGFCEKRRSSGVDSPRYIQTRPGGAVRYRVVDLLAWEEGKMRLNSSYED